MKLDMSNALRPSELFPLRWRCLPRRTRTLDIQETVYKGKVRPYGKTKGSLTKVPIAQQLAKEHTSWGCRKSARTHLRTHLCFQAEADPWIRATIVIACCTNWPRTGIAEADIPGHPSHHRYSWQDERSRQGYSGHDATLQGVDDNGRLYAVVEGEVRTAINSIIRNSRHGYYGTCSPRAEGRSPNTGRQVRIRV